MCFVGTKVSKNVETKMILEDYMKDYSSIHTFVLCAYKESAFLEKCLLSLINQTVKSKIIISTSTPNDYIYGIADKYGIEIFVNTGIKGITGDWNFGYSKAETDYITIAHQDDFYEPEYTERILSSVRKKRNVIIAFSEYYEIREEQKVFNNKLLKIKRFMNIGFRFFSNSKFFRNRILSVGNPICCPAVTFSKNGCEGFEFDNDYAVACDWEAWVRLAQKEGAFVYINKPLMGHRIYEGSTTTKMITNGLRYKEELSIYRRFWPEFISQALVRKYSKAYISNDIK